MMIATADFFHLTPCDGRKSFYGKAIVWTMRNGDRILQSYSTDVCKLTAAGDFVRLWGGYSATTMRHINSFLHYYGIPGGGKAWWCALPVDR